jgi:23S rRNA (cytosine1962-C5)-methyltransferase
MEYQKLKLKKKEEKRIKNGHLWVFSNEVENLDRSLQTGTAVDIFSHDNKFLGRGFFNPHTLIAVRIFTTSEEDIDRDFFSRRIHDAAKLRRKIYPNRTVYRFVHGESDFLPGLIVDKYNDSYSIQLNTSAIEVYQDLITDILRSDFGAQNIILRNDTTAREIEGLRRHKELIMGEQFVEIVDDGFIKFKVNLMNGQKTGMYLDQVENRHLIIPICKAAKVLDCFCNDGGFSLAALKGGAERVTSIDISADALKNYDENLFINELDKERTESIHDNVFDQLKKFRELNTKFDVIILDPPSFTKSKKNLPQAKKGYYVVNHYAFNLIEKNGFIATSSCSHHISEEDFLEIIHLAATKAKKKFTILKIGGAAQDHPLHPKMPETKYLKFVLLKVID